MRGTVRLTQGDQAEGAEKQQEKPLEQQQNQAGDQTREGSQGGTATSTKRPWWTDPASPRGTTNKGDVVYSKPRGGGIILAYVPELIRLILTALISIAATTYIVTTYFYKPIVVIDLVSLVNAARSKSTSYTDDQQRVNYVARYFDSISADIKKRKEVVIVRDALVNAEQFKDITEEYRAAKYTQPEVKQNAKEDKEAQQ